MPVVKKEKKNSKHKIIIKLLISLVFLIFSVALVVSTIKLDVVPTKYLVLASIILLVLNLIADLCLFTKHKWPKIISVILYILILGLFIFGIHFTNTMDKFLDKAFNNQIETISFKFYVFSQNEYKKEDLEGKTVYYYDNSKYIQDAVARLNKEIKLTTEKHEDINALFEQDLFLMDEASFQVLADDLEIDTSKYHIIYTIDLEYKVEPKKEEEPKKKNNKKHYYNVFVGAYDFHGNQMDLNKIVTVNTDTNEILITEIHRFAYLEVPGYTQKNRLNDMSVFGFMNNINALENLLGIKFDYYIITKADGLVTLVDDLGGIEYCSDKAFTTWHAQVINTWDDSKGKKVHIKKGCQHLNGIETLTVARERMAFKMGAQERDKNTTAIMIDILEQMKKPSNLANYATILNDLSGMYNTSIPREMITKTAKQMLNKGWHIETNNIKGKNGTDKIHFSNHKAAVVYLYEDSVNEAIRKIKALDK